MNACCIPAVNAEKLLLVKRKREIIRAVEKITTDYHTSSDLVIVFFLMLMLLEELSNFRCKKQ